MEKLFLAPDAAPPGLFQCCYYCFYYYFLGSVFARKGTTTKSKSGLHPCPRDRTGTVLECGKRAVRSDWAAASAVVTLACPNCVRSSMLFSVLYLEVLEGNKKSRKSNLDNVGLHCHFALVVPYVPSNWVFEHGICEEKVSKAGYFDCCSFMRQWYSRKLTS